MWRWVALSSGAVLLYSLVPLGGQRSRRKAGAGDVLETDFDAFLVKQGDLPTGVASKPKPGAKGQVSGPFETFLKDQDERDPADFSTFLKSASAYRGTKPELQADVQSSEHKAQEEERPTPDMAKVLVLFGTEFGFSKEIAELIAAQLKATKTCWPTIVDMASLPDGYDFSKEQAVLVACSTQGDGVPPTEARDFCDWLFAGKAGPLCHLHFSVCALGDRSYTHFCRAGITIDAALEKAGAQRFVARKDVNKEDWDAVNEWIAAVLHSLPSLGLKTIQELGGTCDDAAAPEAADPGGRRRWGKSRPFPARVMAVEGLCQVSSTADKNTVRVEFDLSGAGLEYLPGDALGIYPVNSTKAVDELLTATGLSGSTPIPVPSHHYEEEQHVKGGTMTLSQALTKCYDLRSPKPDILKLMAQLQSSAPLNTPTLTNGTHSPKVANGSHAAANGGAHGEMNGKTEANGLSNGDHATNGAEHKAPLLSTLLTDTSSHESYFAPRHVVDVLRDFLPPGTQLTVPQLLAVLRPLQARPYSISSSPLENAEGVQATIAEVKYHSLGSDRVGVCSTFISEHISCGDQVHVYIAKNPDFRLPSDSARPIIMVGPGTGLAPFRAFIKHRLLQDSSLPRGPMVLYFGCRRSDQDFLYGSQLEEWDRQGDIQLFKAFSREQAGKVYVQQRLRESAELVWKLLHEQQGHLYVCGDASSMAGAVEKELLKIFESNLGGDASAAALYLEQLSAQKRYQRDVWY